MSVTPHSSAPPGSIPDPEDIDGPDVDAATPPAPAPLFREEAVRAHAESGAEGDVVRIAPRWAEATYWFLAIAAAITIVAVVFGHVREYASGAAIVRSAGHAELAATAPGVVDVVEVRPGEVVHAGQILVRFHSADERHLVESLQFEFDRQLAALLRDPEDLAARMTAAGVRAELDLARKRIEERLLRAPTDGTVYDLRVRSGQRVESGESVAVLTTAERRHELVALLPGRYGPLLHPGQGLRLRLTGYAHTHVDLTIASVADGAVGPSELRRYLGPELGDAIAITQPAIIVIAALPEPTFESDGKTHRYCGGLQGTAEVRVGDERIVFSVLPWAKNLREKLHG